MKKEKGGEWSLSARPAPVMVTAAITLVTAIYDEIGVRDAGVI